ncbi:nitrate ABC transporter permease [Alkalilimnicola ehrlichii]|uniref:Nitrate ABC transporter permease n=1 Tax=Alkalilimnicola ehrlichii TaxID=351052 RepID=A0A3E0WQ25_9GAMM|nr:ABC transporter permease [Alkalilimnicola ehrlichii]RFA26996.1 nitrate ABC transporter permease [Alkalilimnicola ehrlichii]RFA34117.1 nitrate ABC transporter permease [Alkalilimnicola ehrlichii]
MRLTLPNLTWAESLRSLTRGELPVVQWQALARAILLPLIGLAAFLFVWAQTAPLINTSLGQFPGPAQVYAQAGNLWAEHRAEQARAAEFYERVEQMNAQRLAQDPNYVPRERRFSGRTTFIDQVKTSLQTVLAGFIVASVIAIPLGIVIGLSNSLYAAANPVIQLLKPISPLAWLPLVTLVVSALYVTDNPAFSRSFLVSVFTVTLCSLWPTLINTAVGVANTSRDLLNVSRVLRLSWWTHVRRIVLPGAVPMIFTGLRLSLGIAWMVLIAAEMLSQNPGLGKFVWDEFQNGSSASLSRIMVAVIVIGMIGFLLDRSMLLLQRLVSWDKAAVLR